MIKAIYQVRAAAVLLCTAWPMAMLHLKVVFAVLELDH